MHDFVGNFYVHMDFYYRSHVEMYRQKNGVCFFYLLLYFPVHVAIIPNQQG